MKKAYKTAWRLYQLLGEIAPESHALHMLARAILARSPALGVRARLAVDDALQDLAHPHTPAQANLAGLYLAALEAHGYALHPGGQGPGRPSSLNPPPSSLPEGGGA